jgi:hypothetical protein
VHEPEQDVGAPLVADLQAPVTNQPRQRPLDLMPMAAEPLDSMPSVERTCVR